MSTCCPPQEVEDVFSYYKIKEQPKLLLAMTGLSHTEFDQLLRHFQYAWDQYVQNNYIDRDSRKRQYGAGRAESTLVHREDKLLCILYYLKVSDFSDASFQRVFMYISGPYPMKALHTQGVSIPISSSVGI